MSPARFFSEPAIDAPASAGDTHATEALRLSEARYRTLVQAVSQIVWTCSPSGEFVDEQPAWAEYTGQSRDQYAGWGWLNAVHHEDRLRVKQTWRRALGARSPYQAEYRLRASDGAHRWVSARAAPVLASDGAVREWIGTHTDIDAARRAAEERSRLFESERTARLGAERAMARLRAASEMADAAAAESSLDDMLRTLSDRLRRALQVDEATVLLLSEDGTSLSVRAAVGEQGDAAETVAIPIGDGFAGRVARSRVPVVHPGEATLDLELASSSGRSYSLVGAPLLASGRLVGVIHVGTATPREFTEEDVLLLQLVADRVAHAIDRARLLDAERVARADAEGANRAKMEFLAMMSHELRTPLNAIAGYAELLEMGLRGPLSDTQLADVQSIHRNERHLLSLIDEVLTFAKLDAGRIRFEPENVKVGLALASLSDLIAPQIERKQLEYRLEPADVELIAYADLEKLQQIVLNLLSNAVKFTPAGGTITVSAALESDPRGPVAIHVRDSGIGIPPSQLESIFEPFVQLDHGLTRTGHGTGLGLAISRDLARGMNGDLRVRSEPGEGAEFTLLLPRGELARSGTVSHQP